MPTSSAPWRTSSRSTPRAKVASFIFFLKDFRSAVQFGTRCAATADTKDAESELRARRCARDRESRVAGATTFVKLLSEGQLQRIVAGHRPGVLLRRALHRKPTVRSAQLAEAASPAQIDPCQWNELRIGVMVPRLMRILSHLFHAGLMVGIPYSRSTRRVDRHPSVRRDG